MIGRQPTQAELQALWEKYGQSPLGPGLDPMNFGGIAAPGSVAATTPAAPPTDYTALYTPEAEKNLLSGQAEPEAGGGLADRLAGSGIGQIGGGLLSAGLTGNTDNKKQNTAMGAVGGGLTGLQAGASMGPYGAIIGGVAGAVGGGLLANSKKKTEEEKRQEEMAKMQLDEAKDRRFDNQAKQGAVGAAKTIMAALRL